MPLVGTEWVERAELGGVTTYRWSRQPREASLATLSRKTDDATLSCQTLGTGGTVRTLWGGRGRGSDPVGWWHSTE